MGVIQGQRGRWDAVLAALPGAGFGPYLLGKPDGPVGWVGEVNEEWEPTPQAVDFLHDHLQLLRIDGDDRPAKHIESGDPDEIRVTWRGSSWLLRMSDAVPGVPRNAVGLVAFIAQAKGCDLYWIHPAKAPFQQSLLVPRSLESLYRSTGLLGPKAKRIAPLPPNG
jgi:hypothetical protein